MRKYKKVYEPKNKRTASKGASQLHRVSKSVTKYRSTTGTPKAGSSLMLKVGEILSLADLKDCVISDKIFTVADLRQKRRQRASSTLKKPGAVHRLPAKERTALLASDITMDPVELQASPAAAPTLDGNWDYLVLLNQSKPKARIACWQDSTREVRELTMPRSAFVGNDEVFDDVYSLVQADTVTRGLHNINILAGACGTGKDAIIISACQAANRSCVRLHPSEMLSGWHMDRFLKQVENAMQPPDETQVVLSGCEILSTLQMEGLLGFCHDRLCMYPHLYRPLWITTMNTSPLLVQYIMHRDTDFEPHAQLHYLKPPTDEEILRRFPSVPQGVLRCMQGDMRRITSFLGQNPKTRGSAGADVELNPFSIVPRLLKGSRLSRLPPFTPLELPIACLAMAPILDSVTDLLFENLPVLLKARPGAHVQYELRLMEEQQQFSDLLADVDLIGNFIVGEFVNSQATDMAASVLCHATQQWQLRSLLDRFHIGAKHSELPGKRLELEGNRQMMLKMHNDPSMALEANHKAVLDMELQWPASGHFECSALLESTSTSSYL
jgi:hypothetical protein